MTNLQNKLKALLLTAGHTQLPGRGVANVCSFAYPVGNPTRKRSEAATAHTGNRCMPLNLDNLINKWNMLNI